MPNSVCQFQSVIDYFRGEIYLPLFFLFFYFFFYVRDSLLYSKTQLSFMTISFEHGVKSQPLVMCYQV